MVAVLYMGLVCLLTAYLGMGIVLAVLAAVDWK
jgi:hypothetical protein